MLTRRGTPPPVSPGRVAVERAMSPPGAIPSHDAMRALVLWPDGFVGAPFPFPIALEGLVGVKATATTTPHRAIERRKAGSNVATRALAGWLAGWHEDGSIGQVRAWIVREEGWPGRRGGVALDRLGDVASARLARRARHMRDRSGGQAGARMAHRVASTLVASGLVGWACAGRWWKQREKEARQAGGPVPHPPMRCTASSRSAPVEHVTT